MEPHETQEQSLNDIGEEILAALATVARAAQRALSVAQAGISTTALANPSNTMVGQDKAEQQIHAMNSTQRENLRRLLTEPFVARVEVDWGSGAGQAAQTYYVARPSAANVMGAITGACLVTSGAPLGRLAEHEAGDSAVIVVGGRRREGRILSRTVVRPILHEGIWDALVKKFEATPWGDVLELLRHESLRQALEEIQRGPLPEEDILGRLLQAAASAEFERQRIRRKVVDRIALRDQPILDKFQGEVFRLPLDCQVMLFGPPGSGKTTTLIKRLAQKRTPDALTEDEERIISGYLRDNFLRSDSWVMFSPGELLKKYLGEAFNQEGVPDAGNVRTWDRERHDLARNVLGILRSNNSGRFQLDITHNVLVDGSSRGIANLHDEFTAYVETTLSKRCSDALTKLLTSDDEKISSEVRSLQHRFADHQQFTLPDIFGLLDQAEGLQSETKRLNEQISRDLNKIVNHLLNIHAKLLDEIGTVLPMIRAEVDEDADDDTDESPEVTPGTPDLRIEALNVLMGALRNWARAIAEGRSEAGSQSVRVIDFIEQWLPPRSMFVNVGKSIVTRSRLRTLVQAPRALVLGVPASHARFRRQVMRSGRYFVMSEATTNFLSQKKISPDEVDILILVMLRNARRIIQHAHGNRLEVATRHEWLENIESRYLMQVFVDEATDLSAVQLGCTVELANPRVRSWFACGDLRQRITSCGIKERSELEWLNRTSEVEIDIREIDIGYRQSQKLRDLADALTELDSDSKVTTKSPRGSEEADIWPLLRERLSGEELAQWLADRVYEVEIGVGRLPSIGVFVDGDASIDPLVKSTQKMLAERNIPIVGCKEGRVVGDAQEVRVFDVKHIKGLEFEPVFFVGIDRLAERIPDLFQRFLYVGVTRAATYLGLTCEGSLPHRLEPVRSHFMTDTWAQPNPVPRGELSSIT